MIDRDVLERFGWTPDQIVIKRVDEVGAEVPGWTASAALTADTDTFYPGQPRDARGRWTKGRGRYLGPDATKDWVAHIKIKGRIDKGTRAEIEEGLLKAAGKTSQIPLDSVHVLNGREALVRYGRGAFSIVGGYVSPRTGLEEGLVGDEILLTPKGIDRAFADESHVMGVKHVNEGRNWDVPTPGTTNGIHVTLAHEVGHAAYYGLDDDQKFDVEDALARAADMSYAEFAYGLDTMRVAKAVSVYGASNVSEAVAEAWCEYTLSNKPRAAALAVGSYMEGVYK